VVEQEAQKTAVPRKIFANAHAYHINSISLNTDGETYISADDLRINLWNLETSDQSFSTCELVAHHHYPHTPPVMHAHSRQHRFFADIVDIKPANMEELTEVITAAEFHPQSCNYLMYSSSKGTIKLGDLRESALCDQHAKSMSHLPSSRRQPSLNVLCCSVVVTSLSHSFSLTEFEEEEDPANKSFFSEIIASISDIKFSRDGRYILSRDYLTLKEWDLRMENRYAVLIPRHRCVCVLAPYTVRAFGCLGFHLLVTVMAEQIFV
jgi:serine/threonine-protein phosphatase 2A regulatory subunit B